MRFRTFALFLTVTISATARAQYAGPESVEYDARRDRYLVACAGNDRILQRSQDGKVLPFATLDDSPFALEIQGDTLFACVGSSVQGFSLSSGKHVSNTVVPGAFLKGLTTDGHFLYASDIAGQRILRMDPSKAAYTVWVANTEGVPSGVVVDRERSTLWVTFWGSAAPVKGYDLRSGELVTTFTTPLGDIAGAALDCSGNLLLSSWSPSRISRMDPDVPAAIIEDLQFDGLDQPGDIDYDAGHARICIPNKGDQQVLFRVPDGCAEDIFKRADYTTSWLAPNPKDGLLYVELDSDRSEPYMLFSSKGLLLASGYLRPQACLDVRALDHGNYLIDVPRLKQYVRFTKAPRTAPRDEPQLAEIPKR
jgi:hypothetical protein